MRERRSRIAADARSMLAATACICGACIQPTSSGSHDAIGGEQYRALEAATPTSPAISRAARASHAIKTVFLILMENRNWSEIVGNPSAPYINGTLLPLGAHAENYLPLAHPSEPNYVWLEAGDNLGVLNDAPPSYNFRTTRAHLTAYLDAAEVSWKSYQEGIDGKTCPLVAAGLYDPKHNPMIFFDDVFGDCGSRVRPYRELAADLAAGGAVAAYNFVTPDLCHDMHNALGCATNDQVKNGDDWLAAEVPKLMASDAYKTGGAIFITWDEGEGAVESPLGMIVLSPFAKTAYAGPLEYSHSSTLRTMQEIFGVEPLLRAAASSTSLGDLFVTYP